MRSKVSLSRCSAIWQRKSLYRLCQRLDRKILSARQLRRSLQALNRRELLRSKKNLQPLHLVRRESAKMRVQLHDHTGKSFKLLISKRTSARKPSTGSTTSIGGAWRMKKSIRGSVLIALNEHWCTGDGRLTKYRNARTKSVRQISWKPTWNKSQRTLMSHLTLTSAQTIRTRTRRKPSISQSKTSL